MLHLCKLSRTDPAAKSMLNGKAEPNRWQAPYLVNHLHHISLSARNYLSSLLPRFRSLNNDVSDQTKTSSSIASTGEKFCKSLVTS